MTAAPKSESGIYSHGTTNSGFGKGCGEQEAAHSGKDQQTSTSDLSGITLNQRSAERNAFHDKRVSQLPLQKHRKICALLNERREPFCDDFHRLGEMLGLEQWELRDLDQNSKNAADAVLQKFNSKTDGTVRTLIDQYLKPMERADIIRAIEE